MEKITLRKGALLTEKWQPQSAPITYNSGAGIVGCVWEGGNLGAEVSKSSPNFGRIPTQWVIYYSHLYT